MQAVFTGFDSAWSTANSGACCDLELLEDGSLRLAADPVDTNWDEALVRASQPINAADLQVWAVDQPLIVPNRGGCRPVERDLASALMADFGCGAHSSNLGLSPWTSGAPIWKLMRVLHDRGHVHDPMAIPRAPSGRFYFECYPHPAILGLFDLDRILKYKVHHRNSSDWQTLVGLLRSLSSAELPIRNICSFVREDLPQNKSNENRLDSIISAYVAAYWWRFGVQRSTMIGDLAMGYIVTPHSERTFAALARAFGERMNPRDSVSALPRAAVPPEPVGPPGDDRQSKPRIEIPELRGSLPTCDWVYFATPAKWSGTVTRGFVAEQHIIVRSAYNAAGLRIANVQHLKPGERILLVHGGHGKSYRALLSGTIAASAVPVRTSQHCFDVFSYIDESLHERLKAGGYDPDPVVARFTGISIAAVHDLRDTHGTIRRLGMNAIWRWHEVFSR